MTGYRSIDFPSSAPISGAHHRGLAFQILLDTGLEESAELVREGKTGLFIF